MSGYAKRYESAFKRIEKPIRADTAERMKQKDRAHRGDMADIWYSEETRQEHQTIKIHVCINFHDLQ